jgi:hypothetical protein
MKITLKQQLEAFDKGIILDSDGGESDCYNFYDWFCKDTSLKNKSMVWGRANEFKEAIAVADSMNGIYKQSF